MDSVLEFLSDYATALTYDQLPPDAVHQVKRRVIDSIGCALGAYFMEPPVIARTYALQVRANPGATILGTRHRTSPELAAFANGTMARYLDFNDTNMSVEGGHPSDNIPAVLAAAEYAGAAPFAVITGIVLAYEVQDRLGDVYDLRHNGWDHMCLLETHVDEEYSRLYPEAHIFRLEVITRSGERYVKETRYPRGHPKNPMSDQDVEAKFRKLAGGVLGPRQMDRLLERLWHLDDTRDWRDVVSFAIKAGPSILI